MYAALFFVLLALILLHVCSTKVLWIFYKRGVAALTACSCKITPKILHIARTECKIAVMHKLQSYTQVMHTVHAYSVYKLLVLREG